MLLLDEPTSSLDAQAAQAVDQVIKDLVQTVYLWCWSAMTSIARPRSLTMRSFGQRQVSRSRESSISALSSGVSSMGETANIPTWLGVAASVSLVLLAMAVSVRDRLGLTRELAVAAIRAFVQLLVVGALLLIVFERGGLAAAFGWLAIMVVIGGFVAGRRAAQLPRSVHSAMAAIAIAVGVTVGVLLAFQVIAATPEVVIPVGGMVVSGAMAAAALTLRRIQESARDQRERVEARLSLGLTTAEAFAPEQRDAVRTALIPAIDTTKVVGLISLPGAMTGLILAGVDPLEAIRYQIVVMYMLLAAASLASFLSAKFAHRSLFADNARLVSIAASPVTMVR